MFNGIDNRTSSLAVSVSNGALSLYATSPTTPQCTKSSLQLLSYQYQDVIRLDQQTIDLSCSGAVDVRVPLRFASFAGNSLPSSFDRSSVICTDMVSSSVEARLPSQCVPANLPTACNTSFASVGTQFGVSLQVVIPTACPQPCTSQQLVDRDACLAKYPCRQSVDRASCECQRNLTECLTSAQCYGSMSFTANCSRFDPVTNNGTTNGTTTTTGSSADDASRQASLVLFIFIALGAAAALMWLVHRTMARKRLQQQQQQLVDGLAQPSDANAV